MTGWWLTYPGYPSEKYMINMVIHFFITHHVYHIIDDIIILSYNNMLLYY